MFRRRRTEEIPGIVEVLVTEFSIWYWDSMLCMVGRKVRKGPAPASFGVYVQECDLPAAENNLKGATKKASRKEYDRLLSEQHEAEERMHAQEA
jgi:hypothetical protein